MNNARRKIIAEALELVERASNLLEPVRDEEQEAYDNMPEGLQQGERGQQCEAAADALDSAVSSLEEVIDYLNTASE